MFIKLRRIVQSAESAKQQSPGRKPWERHAYEPSPARAAQVVKFLYLNERLFCTPNRKQSAKTCFALAFFPFVLTQGSSRFAASVLGFAMPRFQRLGQVSFA
jgi:hypothetical protein